MRRCLWPRCEERSSDTYCRRHRIEKDRERQARRGDFYAGDHRARAKTCIAAQPWCTHCGKTTDLTAGHTDPTDRNSPLITECRSCNSSAANRRRARAG